MSKPVLAMGLLAVMAGAWYWALTPPTPRASAPAAVADVSRRTTAHVVPAVRLDDLAGRLAGRQAPQGARNPFRVPASVIAHRSGEAGPDDRGARAADPPVVEALPRLDLIGIAEAREAGALVRTAILSDRQGVLHARAGDLVAGIYRLERIGVDGVEVRLLPEDRVLRLALRP